jgi:hypothetical protein
VQSAVVLTKFDAKATSSGLPSMIDAKLQGLGTEKRSRNVVIMLPTFIE